MKAPAAKFLIFFVVFGQIFGCTKSYKEQVEKLEPAVSQVAPDSQYEWYELQIVQWWKARIEYANKINRNNNRPTEARYISVRSTKLLGKSPDEEFGAINPFVVLTCGVSKDYPKPPKNKCLSEQDGKVCWQNVEEYTFGEREKFWVLGKNAFSNTCGQRWSKAEFENGSRDEGSWRDGYYSVVKNPPNTFPHHNTDKPFVIKEKYATSTIEYTGKRLSGASYGCGFYDEVSAQPKVLKIECVAKQDVAEGLNAGVWGPNDELRAFILASHTDDWSDSVKINLAKGLIAKGITRDMARAALGEPKYNETKTEQGQEKVIYQYGAAVDRMTGAGTARLTFIDDKLESWEEQFPTSGSARRIIAEANDTNFAVKLVMKTDESAGTTETRNDLSKKLAIAMAGEGSEFIGGESAGGYGRIHDVGTINTGGNLGKKRERIVGKIALGSGSTTGHCDKGNIEQVVHRRAGAMRACYEEQLQIKPSLAGKITARWIIDLDGTVKDARIAQSSMGNEQVENCLLRSARMMRFAKPVGGTCIVQWPFVFSSEGNFSLGSTANTGTVNLNDLLQKNAKFSDPDSDPDGNSRLDSKMLARLMSDEITKNSTECDLEKFNKNGKNFIDCTASQRIFVRAFNIDDTGEILLDGRRILQIGYREDSDYVDATSDIKPGMNLLRFIVKNQLGGYTWGLEIKCDDSLKYSSIAGRVGEFGARQNDHTKTQQIIFDCTLPIILKKD